MGSAVPPMALLLGLLLVLIPPPGLCQLPGSSLFSHVLSENAEINADNGDPLCSHPVGFFFFFLIQRSLAPGPGLKEEVERWRNGGVCHSQSLSALQLAEEKEYRRQGRPGNLVSSAQPGQCPAAYQTDSVLNWFW